MTKVFTSRVKFEGMKSQILMSWCKSNLRGMWFYHTQGAVDTAEMYWYIFEFRNEEDYVLFNLTWT